MTHHVRHHASLTAGAEKRLLVWMARRLPSCVNSDHLTVLALAAMALAGAGYTLARYDRRALWLVVFALALNWLGDSLDGTLARVRRAERPRYGFYVDHILDIVGMTLLMTGLSCSGFMTPIVALVLLVAYLLVSGEVFLATAVHHVFRMSFAGFGPTELRIVLAIGTVALFRDPHVETSVARAASAVRRRRGRGHRRARNRACVQHREKHARTRTRRTAARGRGMNTALFGRMGADPEPDQYRAAPRRLGLAVVALIGVFVGALGYWAYQRDAIEAERLSPLPASPAPDSTGSVGTTGTDEPRGSDGGGHPSAVVTPVLIQELDTITGSVDGQQLIGRRVDLHVIVQAVPNELVFWVGERGNRMLVVMGRDSRDGRERQLGLPARHWISPVHAGQQATISGSVERLPKAAEMSSWDLTEDELVELLDRKLYVRAGTVTTNGHGKAHR